MPAIDMAYRFTIAAMHLRKVSEATNKAALLNLQLLPTTLKEYYQEAMDRIREQPKSYFQLARKALELMSHAKDLLMTEELQEALCVASGDKRLDTTKLTPFAITLDACLGFISNDNRSGNVEFFHTTFREWLLSTGALWSELQFDIGQTCLTYLMLEDFSKPCNTEYLIVARRQQYPFAAYASRFWADHIRGEGESNLQEPLLSFLTSPSVISSVQLLPETASRDTRLIGKSDEWLGIAESSNLIGLYFCVCLDLQKSLDVILQREFEAPLAVTWGEQDSPLHAAIRLGAKDVTSKLIMKGVWTDVRDRGGMTPLHLVLELSKSSLTLSALQLMKDAKARIDIPDCEGRTAFHYAVRAQSSNVLDYMLKNYTSFGASDWDIEGNTPFHAAVAQDRTWVAEKLLKSNFSPMVQNRGGKSVLAAGIEHGDGDTKSFVQAALKAADAPGASFKIPDQERTAAETFLHSIKEKEANAKQAAEEKKAVLEKQRTRFGTGPLGELAAATEEQRIRDVVSLILQGADVNEIDKASGMTPLHHAVLMDQKEAAWHLLAAGADQDLADSKGVSAKDMAEMDGRKQILAMFSHDHWMAIQGSVGEGPFKRKISGRELKDVYNIGRVQREHSGGSWSYRGTDWFQYLGFRGGHRVWLRKDDY
jgi:ankyrin repeat protein